MDFVVHFACLYNSEKINGLKKQKRCLYFIAKSEETISDALRQNTFIITYIFQTYLHFTYF